MADEDVDTALAQRTDLTRAQIRTLAARSDETAVQLAYDDPAADPDVMADRARALGYPVAARPNGLVSGPV